MRRLTTLFILFFIISLLGIPSSTSASPPLQIENAVHIISQDTSQFPTVKARVRVVSGGKTATGLTPENFTIGENSKDLNVNTSTEPLNLAIVIGNGESADLVKNILREFANNYFQEGDQIWLITLSGTQKITSQTDFLTVISSNAINNAGIREYLIPLETALSTLSALDPTINRQAIYIGDFMNKPQSTFQKGNEFRTAGITIHTIQAYTSSNRGTYTGYFQTLAQNGGGTFVGIYNNENYDELNNLFRDIVANRTVYDLSYYSLNGTSESRTVPITAGSSSGTLSYQVTVPTPTVVLTTTTPTVERLAVAAETEDGQQGYRLTTGSFDLAANVTFANYPRQIASVKLVGESSVEGRKEQIHPSPTQNNTFTWSVESYVEGGEYPLSFYAEVTDEFGLTARSEPLSVNVSVNIPEEFQNEIIVTVESTIEVVINEDSCLDEAGNRKNTPECAVAGITSNENAGRVVSIGLIILVFAFPILLGVMFWQRNQIKTIASGAGRRLASTVVDFGSRVSGIFTGGGETKVEMGGGGTFVEEGAYGYIDMSAGPRSGERLYIDRHRYIFGRLKEGGVNCDFPTLTNISRQHCQIVYNQGYFSIEDLGSGNGTFVNGKRLQPNVPMSLSTGTEVKLGTLDDSAVKFTFVAMRGADVQAGVAARTPSGATTQLEDGSKTIPITDTQYERTDPYSSTYSAQGLIPSQQMPGVKDTRIYEQPMPGVDQWPGSPLPPNPDFPPIPAVPSYGIQPPPLVPPQPPAYPDANPPWYAPQQAPTVNDFTEYQMPPAPYPPDPNVYGGNPNQYYSPPPPRKDSRDDDEWAAPVNPPDWNRDL